MTSAAASTEGGELEGVWYEVHLPGGSQTCTKELPGPRVFPVPQSNPMWSDHIQVASLSPHHRYFSGPEIGSKFYVRRRAFLMVLGTCLAKPDSSGSKFCPVPHF